MSKESKIVAVKENLMPLSVYSNEISQLENKVKKLKEQLPTPQFKVGEHVLKDNFKEVVITKIEVAKEKHLFSKANYHFIYTVKHADTSHIIVETDGIPYKHHYFDYEIQVPENDLKPIPSRHVLYLQTLIEELLEKQHK